MRRLTLCTASALVALLFFATSAALAQDTTMTDDTTMQAEPPSQDDMAMQEDTTDAISGETVVTVIQNSPDHATLASALEAAELVDALEESGPFAVLAPTDEAFEALPAGRLDSLLLTQNREELRRLLRHHVLVGDLSAERLTARIEDGRDRIETVSGDSVQFSAQGGTVMVGNATVTETDLPASNGLVHVIDAVLVPTAQPGAMQEDSMEDGMMDDSGMDADTSMEGGMMDDSGMDADTSMEGGMMDDSGMDADTSMSDTPGANR